MSDTLTAGLNLDYRPATYWRGTDTTSVLMMSKHSAPGGVGEGGGAVAALAPVGESLGYCEFLPALLPGEVEIVRVRLASTTWDVISVRARPEDGWIHYRIVDEYGVDYELPTESSKKPLTLAEVIELIDRCDDGHGFGGFGSGLIDPAWASNLQSDPEAVEEVAGFIEIDSPLYPEIDKWYERKQAAFVAEHTDEDDLDPDDDEGEAAERDLP